MIDLDSCTSLPQDDPAPQRIPPDLYFEPHQGLIIEVTTLPDGTPLRSQAPVGAVIRRLSTAQTIAVAEAILRHCTRGSEKRPMSEANRLAFDKLVAEMNYDLHEIQEIKEAISDYYD